MTTATTVNQGDAITRAREAVGLSRFDLADEIKLSLWTVSAWERGTLTPSDSEWALLAYALGVTVDSLRAEEET